jgi:WD40 repeat protein
MDIKTSVVAILNDKNKIMGTGFVAGENLILTCAHVVEQVTAGLNERVTIRFSNNSKADATVDQQSFSPSYEKDVAILRVDSLPQGITPLPLGNAAGSAGHDFYAYGYASVIGVQGIGARGKIVDIVDNGRLVQLTSQEPDHGMSGGPVWDDVRRVVIGIIAKGKTSSRIERNMFTTFAISADVVNETCVEIPFKVNIYNITKLFNVPLLPLHYVERTSDLMEVKNSLLKLNDKTEGESLDKKKRLGLLGMGGIGKSIIATALARDLKIRERFPDGVIWVTLGQEPNILARQSQIAEALGEKNRFFQDSQQGKAIIGQLASDKKLLLILDDAWDVRHVANFDVLPDDSCIILTTREETVIDAFGAEKYVLQLPNLDQCFLLLAEWVEKTIDTLPNEAEEIIKECGYLPLAIAMIGALIRQNPKNWIRTLDLLKDANLEKIKYQFQDYPYPSLLKAIQISLDALPETIRDRYIELSVFPEKTPIPFAALKILWRAFGIEENEIVEIVDILVNGSLLFENSDETFLLHDLQHDFLYTVTQSEKIKLFHEKFIQSYYGECNGDWVTGPNDGYYYQNLSYHFHQSANKQELENLLANFAWLIVKLEKTDFYNLISDYEKLFFLDPMSPLRQMIKVLWQSYPALSQDKSLLASQLLGRINKNNAHPLVQSLLQSAEHYYKEKPWLNPKTSSLSAPDKTIIRTLTGNKSEIIALCTTREGLLISSGGDYPEYDQAIRFWDLDLGKEVLMLGYQMGVRSMAVTDSGNHLVALGEELVIWDIKNRERCFTNANLIDFGGRVAQTSNGRWAIISGFISFYVWDFENWTKVKDIPLPKTENFHPLICSLAISDDGDLAVIGFHDNSVAVYRLEDSKPIYLFNADLAVNKDNFAEKSMKSFRSAVAISHNKQVIIYWGTDDQLKAWDIQTGEELIDSFEKNAFGPKSIVIIDNNRFILSGEKSIKLWSIKDRQKLFTWRGHNDYINAITLLPNKVWFASGSGDRTIKIWDIENTDFFADQQTEEKQEDNNIFWIETMFPIPGQNEVVYGQHNRWYYYDINADSIVREFDAYGDYVIPVIRPKNSSLLNMPLGTFENTIDHHLITAHNNEIVLQELHSGKEIAKFKTGWDVCTMHLSTDARWLVTGHINGRIQIWDIEYLVPFPRYDLDAFPEQADHLIKSSSPVTQTSITPKNDLFISKSHYKNIRFWNMETGNLIHEILDGGDGKFLLSANQKNLLYATNHNLHFINLDDFNEFSKSIDSDSRINRIFIDQNDRYIFTTVTKNTWPYPKHSILIWDFSTAELVGELIGHSDSIQDISISPDGHLLVTVSYDNAVRLWDVEQKKQICQFVANGILRCCVFTDNKNIVAGGHDGKLHTLIFSDPNSK